jgi:hypothetical protein
VLSRSRPCRLAAISHQPPSLLTPPSQDSPVSQSQSYVTTDGQPACLSWCQASIWGLRPDFYYCQTVAGLLMSGALSDERTSLPFIVVAGPRQSSHSWESRGTRDHIFLSQIRDSPSLEGQVDSWSLLYSQSLRRTAQKTPLPRFTRLLRATELLPRNGYFSGFAVLDLNKYATMKIVNRSWPRFEPCTSRILVLGKV